RRNTAEYDERATGTITHIRYASQREWGQVGYPRVRFTAAGGQVVEAEAPNEASEEDGQVVGAEVGVVYKSANPEQFQLGGPGARAASTVFFVLGGVCDVLGALFL